MWKRGARVRAVGAAVVLLLIGCAVTVATSWGAAVFGNGRMGRVERVIDPSWPRTVPSGWGAAGDVIRMRAWFGEWSLTQSEMLKDLGPLFAKELGGGSLVEADFGFPFRAFGRWEFAVPLDHDGSTWKRTPHGEWPVQLPLLGLHQLPVAPLWPGFALNTLFYAVLAWGLWQLPLALRRRSRAKRGACVRCGYDLKGLAAGSACPECNWKR